MAAQFVNFRPGNKCDVCQQTFLTEDDVVHEAVRNPTFPAEIIDPTIWCLPCYKQTGAQHYHRIHDGPLTRWNVDKALLAGEIADIFRPKVTQKNV